MQRVPASAPRLLCAAMHGQTAANLHVQPGLHPCSPGTNATCTAGQTEKQNIRNVVFTVIKNDFNNITSSFPITHSVEGCKTSKHQPYPVQPTLPQGTGAAQPPQSRNCLLQDCALGERTPRATPSGKPDPSSEKCGQSLGTWLCWERLVCIFASTAVLNRESKPCAQRSAQGDSHMPLSWGLCTGSCRALFSRKQAGA